MIDIETTNIGTHALLITSEGKIILQQRENKAGIVNPGLISMFGGTIEKDEELLIGLKRELREELDLEVADNKVLMLGTYYKTKEIDNVDYTIHVYVVLGVDKTSLNLHEGSGFVIDTCSRLLKNNRLTRITKLALEEYASKYEL